jgi:hypothetical protein
VRSTGHDGERAEDGVLAGVESARALVGRVRTVAVADVPLIADGRAGGLQRVDGGAM